jgi:hypothetical protein
MGDTFHVCCFHDVGWAGFSDSACCCCEIGNPCELSGVEAVDGVRILDDANFE